MVLAAVPVPRVDPDADLVEAARGGDRRAFSDLYRRHIDWVHARLTRLIGPVPEREDLTQQVFVDVHRALPSFRGDAAFTTFLHRIVVNHACDHLERRRRRPAPVDPAALDDLIAPGASPEVRARQRQELALAFELLGRIKPAKRVAFLLVAVEGLSLDEAAALVGAKTPAVKQRVLAARRELGALLEQRR
jgi:RNA polymerase sigma-70 factor (ECF subfamily)